MNRVELTQPILRKLLKEWPHLKDHDGQMSNPVESILMFIDRFGPSKDPIITGFLDWVQATKHGTMTYHESDSVLYLDFNDDDPRASEFILIYS
jgi:hypothetical protein